MQRNFSNLNGRGAGAFPDIPEDYFDKLPERLISQINMREKRKPVRTFFIYAVAASIVVLIGLAVLLFDRDRHNQDNHMAELHNNTLDTNLDLSESVSDSSGFEVETDLSGFQSPNVLDTSSDDDYEKLLASLDDLPSDIILKYLNEIDELGF